MIDEHCLGPGVDVGAVSGSAQVTGSSYITGSRTRIGPGAVVANSRLHDVIVGPGAKVADSIIVAEGEPHSHKCDAAGRTVVRGADQPQVGPGASASGCTLINCSVGPGTRITDTWAKDVRVGPGCRVSAAKLILVETGPAVTVAGPTEVSEAYLGRGTTIDSRGYYEGIFSNAFHQIRFDEAAGRLVVAGTIDLPHVSRYGTNTINSTNSGKLLPQPGGVLTTLGPQVGLWHDELLSHEQIELGPCCWVTPWTKVIGQSPDPHLTDDDLVNDSLSTYLMPFAMAGWGGQSTQGLVMPGELSTGFGPKQRKGAWVFTYAPDAVIAMVARLHEALEDGRKRVADTIVTEALRTALEMTKAMAAGRAIDLDVPPQRQRRGWPRWTAETHRLLRVHLDAGLWEFAGGQPTGWRRDGDRWAHPNIEGLLAVAPDALAGQVSENELFAFDGPVPSARVAVPSGNVQGTGGPPVIDGEAQVAACATVAPGCRIGPGAVIEEGAVVWNSVVEGGCVGAGALVERSVLSEAEVGAGAVIRSCRLTSAALGDRSLAECASVANSALAADSTVSAFADVDDVAADFAAIIGGTFRAADVGVFLMTMHMAGACAHLKAVPVMVEVDGKTVAVPAIPMLGGGSVIRGTEDAPVEMAGCFIGSNAVVEANTFVGFGSFVLGTLGPDEGLLPFTVSTGPTSTHQIGGVLGRLASTAITHFLGWSYQAVGPELAPAVAVMAQQMLRVGTAAIEWELARREQGGEFGGGPYEVYRSLPHYSEAQLRAGLDAYGRALESGAWELEFTGGELRFSSDRGHWEERGGSALWRGG